MLLFLMFVMHPVFLIVFFLSVNRSGIELSTMSYFRLILYYNICLGALQGVLCYDDIIFIVNI